MNSGYRSACQPADFHPKSREFFRGRTVAVTGGTGFIGSHLVEQLLELEASCIVLSRSGKPGFLAEHAARIDLRACDLESLEATRQAIRGASVVLNLAASVAGLKYNSEHPASIFDANMRMFLNVIRASQEAGVERFLVTSSACVYPRFCSLPTPESEGFAGEPEPTNSGYGWAKRMQEYLGAQYAREFGLPVAIARPYNAYGPRDNFAPETSHVIPALIRKAYETPGDEFEVWGDGTHSRSFLYVDDFARGLVEVAARYPVADPVNLGADEEITIGDVAREIGKVVSELRGSPIVPRFQPAGLTGQPRRHCDTSKAIRELGFQSHMPFREGLRRTIHWYAEHANHTLSSHS
jgi:GDP-L-fucose synthase